MKDFLKEKWWLALIAVVAFVAIIVGIYFIFGGSEKGIFDGGNKNLTYEKFTISDHKGEYKEYIQGLDVEGYPGAKDFAYYVTGKIKNGMDNNYSYVIIRFNLYDNAGTNLGEAVVALNDLEKNTEQTFTALSLLTSADAQKVVKYDIKSVTGGIK